MDGGNFKNGEEFNELTVSTDDIVMSIGKKEIELLAKNRMIESLLQRLKELEKEVLRLRKEDSPPSFSSEDEEIKRIKEENSKLKQQNIRLDRALTEVRRKLGEK